MAVTNKEYCLPNELPIFYDKRRLLGLISDSGIPITEADLGDDSSTGFISVQKLLRAVGALIDSRCQQGKRYSRTDLETIAYEARTSNSLTDTNYEAKQKRFAVLQKLAADLFFGDLVARRGYAADTMRQLAPSYESALLLLEQLFDGVAIFDLDGPKNAGVPSVQVLAKNRLLSSDFNRMFGIWPTSAGQTSYGLFGGWRY